MKQNISIISCLLIYLCVESFSFRINLLTTPSTPIQVKRHRSTWNNAIVGQNVAHQNYYDHQSSSLFAFGNNNNDDEDRRVNVNIFNDVDPLTLTAIGFALIACNFFIFGNMGDFGLGGFVARIINAFRWRRSKRKFNFFHDMPHATCHQLFLFQPFVTGFSNCFCRNCCVKRCLNKFIVIMIK